MGLLFSLCLFYEWGGVQGLQPHVCIQNHDSQVTPFPWPKDNSYILNRGSKSNCKVNKNTIRTNDLIHELFMLAIFGMPRF